MSMAIDGVLMKRCTKCGIEKHLDFFTKSKNICKKCKCIYYKKYREANYEKVIKKQAVYREEHREKGREYAKIYKIKNIEKVREKDRLRGKVRKNKSAYKLTEGYVRRLLNLKNIENIESIKKLIDLKRIQLLITRELRGKNDNQHN